jgi:hypothetical protein
MQLQSGYRFFALDFFFVDDFLADFLDEGRFDCNGAWRVPLSPNSIAQTGIVFM